jgi:hypothetical protein
MKPFSRDAEESAAASDALDEPYFDEIEIEFNYERVNCMGVSIIPATCNVCERFVSGAGRVIDEYQLSSFFITTNPCGTWMS